MPNLLNVVTSNNSHLAYQFHQNVIKLGRALQSNLIFHVISHVTTYITYIAPRPSIRQAEMEECNRGFVPVLTLKEEAFGKLVNPKFCLVLLLCPRML